MTNFECKLCVNKDSVQKQSLQNIRVKDGSQTLLKRSASVSIEMVLQCIVSKAVDDQSQSVQ